MRVNAPGWFITFEGLDGSGKSTQLAHARHYLEGIGVSVVVTREPGGTLVGEAIRSLLLQPSRESLHARAELLLYAADRAQHIEQVVKPSLALGSVVLCDRFADATVAYQGGGRGIDLGIIADATRLATGGVAPDLTFLLDIDLETRAQRLSERGAGADRLESADGGFHTRVRSTYLRLAQEEPRRIVALDGAQGADAIQRQIRTELHSRGIINSSTR